MPVTQILSSIGRSGGSSPPPPPPPYQPTDSGQSLGVTWTVELVVETQPTSYWATLWGNENYNAGLGHFAYFSGSTSLYVGTPSGGNNYTVADIGIGTRAYWAFTHQDGGGVNVYRNGVLLTPDISSYVQASPASNTLLWGGRHNNDGTGFVDTLPGNYLYTNIRNTALDTAGVVNAFNAISGDYGFTPIPVPPFSLEFVENQSDYLEAAGSADWNLGSSWTIEFWIKANAPSATAQGGIWGLLNQVGWSTTNAIVVALSDNKLVFLSVASQANNDVRYVEPTPGQWTHVAIVNNIGTQKVFYNGVEQARVSGQSGTASYTNSTDPLRIGRLGPANGGTLNGKMALIRISDAVKYSNPFTPSITYGADGDTRLFLGTDNPLVDSRSHTITNHGVALSNDVPGAFAPLSLQLVQSQTDYLDVAASTDWALSRTWTIEFWSKASKVSTEGDLLTVMCQDYTDGNSIQIIYQGGSFEIQGTNRIAAEPPIGGVPTTLFNVYSQGGWNGGGDWTNLSTTGGTGTGLTVSVAGVQGGYVNALSIVTPGSGYTSGDVITAVGESSVSFTIGSCTPIGVWTHVALVNTVADGMTLYYNGVSQYTGGYWSLANNTAPIRIGARGPADFQRFDGLLAMIRISNTAKYSTTFTPTITYGVEGDTKLFLGLVDPLTDAKGHITTNNGVTVSTDFPTPPTYTLTAAADNVDEGSSLTFTAGGTNIANDTYYWNIETNAGDFGTTNGSFSITGNSGSFSVTPSADSTTEGPETFTVTIRSGSITGIILASSNAITINDVSQDPPPPPPPPPPTQYTLSVHVEGSGTVTSSPGNISAMNGMDSSDVFDESSYVNLTASPDLGYDFVGWSGDFSSGSANTVVLMDNNYSATATFETTPPPPPPTLVSIAITPANSNVFTGNDTTVQFTATGTYSDGSTADLTNTVTWESTYGATNYSIDSTGLLRLMEGETNTTTITATLNGISDTTVLSFA